MTSPTAGPSDGGRHGHRRDHRNAGTRSPPFGLDLRGCYRHRPGSGLLGPSPLMAPPGCSRRLPAAAWPRSRQARVAVAVTVP